jgi:hypothetical protein
MEQQDDQKKAEKKRKQAEAWQKWRKSPKGAAYVLKQKMKAAGVDLEHGKS